MCQVEHYQRATALDGSRLHWLGTGPAVVVGFDASSLMPCQMVLGRVGSSPQVFGLGVIELARTMSRGPRARNGQNHVFNRCDGSVMTGAMPIFPPIASPSTLVAVQYRTVLTNFSLICGCVSSNCIQFSSLFAMNASRESHHTSCSTLNFMPKLVDDLSELLSRDMICRFDDKRNVLERPSSRSTRSI